MRSMLSILSLFLACGPVLGAGTEKPNIILILADDLGIPALGCTGGIYKTPNLDALAAGGTRFERCFAAPLCAPSRALLMTGRYAFRTGVKNNGLGAQATPEKDGCVALRLKQAGYATAVAGKWRQLSHFTTKEDGAKWGYDEFLIWGAGLPDEEGERSEGRKKQKQNAEEKGQTPAKGNAKLDRYWDPDYNLNGKVMPDSTGKYGPDVLHDFVVDFIKRHRQGPFFIYYPTPLIHGPILKTPDSPGAEEKLKRKATNAGEGSLYADNIQYLDKLVGKLVAELDALKLRENTLVMFVGDNGSVPIGTVNGRPVDGKKSNLLEGGSRVPLIVNWPGTTPADRVLKDLIDFSDMLPTFTELAGVSPSDSLKIDGHSFAAQIRGEKGQPREWAYVQLGEGRYVRSDRWKLTGDGELFDMRDAPYKQTLVPPDSTDPEAKAARATLQTALSGLMKQDTVPATARKKRKKQAS